MDYTKLFYWLTVADNAKIFLGWGIGIFILILLISTIVNGIGTLDGEDVDIKIRRTARKWQHIGLIMTILLWGLYSFTPNKKDLLLIVAGGQTLNYLSTDTIDKQIPREISNFVLTELKNMAKESEVDLNISNRREEILNDVKNMPADEVIQKMKDDPELEELLLK